MTTRSATIAAQGSLERSEDASPAPHSGAGFVRVGVKATRPRGQSERDNTKRPSRREQRAKTRSEDKRPIAAHKKTQKKPPAAGFPAAGAFCVFERAGGNIPAGWRSAVAWSPLPHSDFDNSVFKSLQALPREPIRAGKIRAAAKDAAPSLCKPPIFLSSVCLNVKKLSEALPWHAPCTFHRNEVRDAEDQPPHLGA